jgi:hypothetical protein
MLWNLLLSSILAGAAPVESQFDILGYSPELGVIFAQSYVIPDNGKCVSFILDLEKKTKFSLPPLVGVHEAIVASGEDEEGSSCQLREFAAALEIKLKTAKTYTPEEKKLVDPVASVNWKKTLPGFKDGSVGSLGAFLRTYRPQWHPEMAAKVYDLGAAEAEDKDWMDGFSSMVIAAEWKPGYTTKEGRERSKQAVSEAEKLSLEKADAKAQAKSVLALEMAVRLDPKNARALLALAKVEAGGFERRAKLVGKALAADPVMTTRAYREDTGFADLRCSSKAVFARKGLPEELTKDLKCSP